MSVEESCEVNTAESAGALKRDTLRAGDWQINGEVRSVTGCKKLVVLCDRPGERRAWIKLRALPLDECVEELDEMMQSALAGLSGACVAQGEKVAK